MPKVHSTQLIERWRSEQWPWVKLGARKRSLLFGLLLVKRATLDASQMRALSSLFGVP